MSIPGFLALRDVSSQRAVRDLVAAYVASGAPLHVLVNNAGCMAHARAETEEGLEVNFATNALGPFSLTEGFCRRCARPPRKPASRRG